MTIFSIILVFFICICILVGALFIFYRFIYARYKLYSNINSPEVLLSILNVLIETEFEAYNNTIFQTMGSITNAQYDNYYNEITRKLIDALSPILVYQLSAYVGEDFVYRLIARRVKEYLKTKINGTV